MTISTTAPTSMPATTATISTAATEYVEPEEAVRRRRASARHTAAVKDLLDRRGDLAGTIALADLIHDASTWAA